MYITKFNDKFFSEELNNINLRFNVVDNNERKIENLAEKN